MKSLGQKHLIACFRLFWQITEVNFQIQRKSKNVAPFHAIEQRYFIAIQVLLIKKEPVKSTMNWYVVSCQKEAVSMSWHNRILLWWWTISILIKEKSWTTVAHTKHSAFTMEKMCLRDWDAHRLPPRTSS